LLSCTLAPRINRRGRPLTRPTHARYRLAASKSELQARLKRNLYVIHEKELTFYIQNCRALGTISVFLAIFANGSFYGRYAANFRVPDSSFLQVWNVFTMLAMMLELVVVCKTTQLTIFMPGLSLRGPEGSVSRAVGIMREEHEKVVRFFGAGILCFVFSAMCQCWILFGFYDKDYCVAAGGRWVEDGGLPLRPGTPRCDFNATPPSSPPSSEAECPGWQVVCDLKGRGYSTDQYLALPLIGLLGLSLVAMAHVTCRLRREVPPPRRHPNEDRGAGGAAACGGVAR